MHQQLSKAHKWLDNNLKELFSEYIPQFQTFTPIKGYEYPKRGDRLRFSNQLGTYADQLCTLHPSTNPQESSQTDQKTNLHYTKTVLPKLNPLLLTLTNTQNYHNIKPKDPNWRNQISGTNPASPECPTTINSQPQHHQCTNYP